MSKAIPILALCAVLFAIGCAGRVTPPSAAEVAYKTLASTQATVDTAMKAWADYVVAGHAKPEDEAVVQTVYSKYQVAIRAAARIPSTLKPGESSLDLDLALRAVEVAAAELLTILNSLQ